MRAVQYRLGPLHSHETFTRQHPRHPHRILCQPLTDEAHPKSFVRRERSCTNAHIFLPADIGDDLWQAGQRT